MRALRTVSAVATVAVAGLALAGCSIIGGNDEDSVFNLKVGDCMNITGLDDTVENVPTVACSEQHEAEIYSSTDLPDGDFPGGPSVDASATDYCTTSFEDFIGVPYDSSEIYGNSITPTSESWGQGDHQILCFAYEVDEAGDPTLRTGTLEGAKR